jgi:hypothetical protein
LIEKCLKAAKSIEGVLYKEDMARRSYYNDIMEGKSYYNDIMKDPTNPTAEAYSSIVQHLNNMINYNDFQSDALSLFKTNIAHLSEQLFLTISPNTHLPIEKWHEHLVAQQKILGYPQYKRADDHSGVAWYLVDTPENKMLEYINDEINAIYTIVKKSVRSVKNTQSCVSNQYFVQTTRRRHT